MKRSIKERIADQKPIGYRLPTAAEWEYAARADTTTTWHFGDDPAELPIRLGQVHAVATPTRLTETGQSLRLTDTIGNVWDGATITETVAPVGPLIDPMSFGGRNDVKESRGGYWGGHGGYPSNARPAFRLATPAGSRWNGN